MHYFAEKCNEHLQEKGENIENETDETYRKLIDGTIDVIARDGLDKASTKQIKIESGLNVVYIYR